MGRDAKNRRDGSARGTQWVIPFVALVYPFTAILPVFLFALYRNRGALLIPRRLGVLAMGTAVVYAILIASWLQDSIRDTSVLLGELSNGAYILLLIAIFRNKNAEAEDIPVSRRLRLAAKVASIAYGVWSAFLFVALALSRIAYWQLRNYALQKGIRPPATWTMELNQLRTALSQACLFVAPYVVYSATRRGPEGSSDPRAIIGVAPIKPTF